MGNEKDMASEMKSAYELALERMEQDGIERPDEKLSEETRKQVAEIRSQAEARLAELEILHRDREQNASEPVDEEEYLRERRRIETRRDEKIDALRAERR